MPQHVVAHDRPANDEADDLVRLQRLMFWLRLVAVASILTEGWLYELVSPVLLCVAAGLEVAAIAAQSRLVVPGRSVRSLRRTSTLLLMTDLLVVYLVGTNLTADAQWIGFYFYPLMSLEAAVIAGVWVGLAVTALSILVYLVQAVLHVGLGYTAEPRAALAAISLIALTGGFMVLYAHTAERGRNHLRAMLHLSSALARHERQADAIHHLDRRLHAALGARVRAVAMRQADGDFLLVQWQTADERHLTQAQLRRALGDDDELLRHLAGGAPVTLETDAWSVLTATLRLPEWASAVTLVPIVSEGRWIGLLPVLWPARIVPDRDQVQLLNGLAGQIGLAMARGELEQMRREATVDPLTGLLNRRAISAELEAFAARSGRSGGRMAVLLCEVGHPDASPSPDLGPDATLRKVATAVRSVLRNGDVAGRHDDDRLLVLAADADTAAAHALGERIRSAVAALPGGAGVRLVIGVAAYPEHGTLAADLVDVADAAIEATAPREPARSYLAAAATPEPR
jgi:diguanylate cyclase (GGDEF)-like protein